MTNRSAERTQFHTDILTTGMSTGYSWFRYDDIQQAEDGSYLSAKVEEQIQVDDYKTEYRDRGVVNVETVAKAFGILRAGPVEYMAERDRLRILLAYEDMDAGDIDGNDADSLLQLGILGAIVYG
jgi:hypothetical protein